MYSWTIVAFLLHLIEVNDMDILDIPIKDITDQYLAVLSQSPSLSSMGDFLVMAATLLDIKSRMLLPPRLRTDDGEDEEEGEDPRGALMKQLLEYKEYKRLGQELKTRGEEAGHILYRHGDVIPVPEEPVDPSELLSGITAERLKEAFERAVAAQKGRRDPVRAGFGKIKKEPCTVEERMVQVSRLVKTREKITLEELLAGETDKAGLVTTFLAVLELVKQGDVALEEKEDGEGQFSLVSPKA
jgi:segregation and condensation protein A